MEILRLVLLFLHILGWAALFGGLLVQARAGERRVTGPVRDGVGTAVLTGLALVGVLEAGGGSPDHVKIGVKLVIGLVLLVLVMTHLRKPVSSGLWFTLLGLTVLNIAVAVFWSPAHTF